MTACGLQRQITADRVVALARLLLPPLAMRFIMLAIATVIVAACGGSPKHRTNSYVDEPTRPADRGATNSPSSPAGDVSVTTDGGDDLSWLGPVYFQFDSAELTQPTRDALVRLHAWLVSHPAAKLTIEGHCDEQGTTEYNIALGQRRAQAITDYLVRLGTEARRLTAVSYGAERPAVDGHDEIAYAKNRRGELHVAP